MTLVFFSYFAAVIIISGILVISLSNPVYSVLNLLVMFFHVAGIYILLNAEFIAAVQIIVYAGAILVLYLFVVMLLNLSGKEKSHTPQVLVGSFIGLALFVEVVVFFNRSSFSGTAGSDTVEKIQTIGNTRAIGESLFTTYLWPFEIASLVLLAAMIGAIVLSKNGILRDQWSEKKE
ncbi:MAG: NADH-quinone oxidoreductase subunit J [Nitrospirae bacterium]|nr:NADH-quinone oxidoreductase subunit J [Nitrospirota bacterium]MBI3352346.1 NADH-quinone oxidoreductase subunit J [Nitrospirota bacterium]